MTASTEPTFYKSLTEFVLSMLVDFNLLGHSICLLHGFMIYHGLSALSRLYSLLAQLYRGLRSTILEYIHPL